MKFWLRGKRGGLVAFIPIAALVAGGLGWVTAAALRLEQEHREARAQAELQSRLQLALSLLDSRVRPILAREDSRPYNHYSALFAPSMALASDGTPLQPGRVLEPSPLLGADLPEWMLLHFQVDEENGWGSPQVLSPPVQRLLDTPSFKTALTNVTSQRAQLLATLSARLAPRLLLAAAREHGAEPTLRDTALVPAGRLAGNNNEMLAGNSSLPGQQQGGQGIDLGFLKRADQQYKVQQESRAAQQKDDLEIANSNTSPKPENWMANAKRRQARSEQVEVVLSPMAPLWLTTADGQDRLLVARLVRVADRQVCQGIALDGQRLRKLLAEEVNDLFPEACIVPLRDEAATEPEQTLRAMTALPLQLDPGPIAALPALGWTPLRVGLSLAWAAALVALLAVGLGGWSLLDLSDRRIRFVSAVTHELRTPLTTLRLYLDMLTGGLIREETQREEYLRTLHAEAERLTRLVGNVLDFSRLENQRPRLAKETVRLAELVEQVRATWQGRCQDAGKELVVENGLDAGTVLETDGELVQQVLGNLLDNACKYSRGAADGHLWLRARQVGKRLVLEVEDRGPGVPQREQRAIFRPFRRGRDVEVTAGGVGLGLALAERWARLLGGRMTLHSGPEGVGACFRLELPS